MIPYGRQLLDQDDYDAVLQVLQSHWLTQGPAVPAFEQAVAAACQAPFAVAMNSATSALHLACLALGVGPGDRVWTSPNSFVASANCARYCHADVDFVDIEPETGNLCTTALAIKLRQAAAQNRLPKVVIPVHFAGQPCDMLQIAELAAEYGFSVIEDASHAIGAHYQQQAVGNGMLSDITVFSFHPVKIITAAEGGMALTRDPALARKLQLLRSHGITSDAAELTEPSHGPWYYQQQILGFNYRMTDLQAALGLSQLHKLSTFVSERNQLATFYDSQFAGHTNIVPLHVKSDRHSSYHLYVIRIKGLSRRQHKACVEFLRGKGIVGHLHYIPIYLQPYYQQLGFHPGHCPNAEHYYAEAVTLPLFPGLKTSEQQYVVATLNAFLSSI